MSKPMMEVQRNRQVRGQILMTLELSHPMATPQASVASALISALMIQSPDITPYVDYLEDRGYIRVFRVPDAVGGEMVALKLTSKGVDLLEETVEDAGVDI